MSYFVVFQSLINLFVLVAVVMLLFWKGEKQFFVYVTWWLSPVLIGVSSSSVAKVFLESGGRSVHLFSLYLLSSVIALLVLLYTWRRRKRYLNK